MIKILFVIDSLMAGGMEWQLVELATRMDSRQFDVHIVCLYGVRAGRSLHFGERLNAVGVSFDVLDLDWSAWSKVRAIYLITQQVRRHHPHIVHALNYHSNLLTRLSRPLWWTQTKLVAGVRNAQTPKMQHYDWASQWLFDAIVVNGKQLEQSLIREVGIAPHKVEQIPNGIDLTRFQPADSSVTDADSIRKLVVMLGRITEQKSPHLLAEAVGKLHAANRWHPDDKVFIVGETQHSDQLWYDKLIATVEQYSLQEIVLLKGKTSTPETVMQRATITALPSLWEGLPNVVLESLATATPVIVSEAANEAQVIQHEREGWVVPTSDIDALADTLYTALNLSDTTYEQMQAACMKTVQQYSMQHMVEAHQNLYKRLIRKR